LLIFFCPQRFFRAFFAWRELRVKILVKQWALVLAKMNKKFAADLEARSKEEMAEIAQRNPYVARKMIQEQERAEREAAKRAERDAKARVLATAADSSSQQKTQRGLRLTIRENVMAAVLACMSARSFVKIEPALVHQVCVRAGGRAGGRAGVPFMFERFRSVRLATVIPVVLLSMHTMQVIVRVFAAMRRRFRLREWADYRQQRAIWDVEERNVRLLRSSMLKTCTQADPCVHACLVPRCIALRAALHLRGRVGTNRSQ
jgi:hypothetical protein